MLNHFNAELLPSRNYSFKPLFSCPPESNALLPDIHPRPPLLPHLTYPYLTPSLLSSNPESNPRPGLLDDTASIRSAILSVIEKGGDVVLVVHSHAAIPRSAAVEGLDGRTRKEPGCLQQMHPYFWRSAEPDSWYVSLLASYIPANAGAIIQTQLRSLPNGVDVAQQGRNLATKDVRKITSSKSYHQDDLNLPNRCTCTCQMIKH